MPATVSLKLNPFSQGKEGRKRYLTTHQILSKIPALKNLCICEFEKANGGILTYSHVRSQPTTQKQDKTIWLFCANSAAKLQDKSPCKLSVMTRSETRRPFITPESE